MGALRCPTRRIINVDSLIYNMRGHPPSRYRTLPAASCSRGRGGRGGVLRMIGLLSVRKDKGELSRRERHLLVMVVVEDEELAVALVPRPRLVFALIACSTTSLLLNICLRYWFGRYCIHNQADTALVSPSSGSVMVSYHHAILRISLICPCSKYFTVTPCACNSRAAATSTVGSPKYVS